MADNSQAVCVIAGAGAGNGAALANRYLMEGYQVVLLARDIEKLKSLPLQTPERAHLMACDLTQADQVKTVIAQTLAEIGPIKTLVYNAGNAVFDRVDNTQAETVSTAWQVNCLGLYLMAEALVPHFEKQGGGDIFVMGATASLRGGAGFFSFSSAKAAQKSMAESMCKALAPKNIHVSYIIVDGVIDMPMTRAFFTDKEDDFFLDPNAIADSVWHLSQQHRSAWTFMLDVRPYGENW